MKNRPIYGRIPVDYTPMQDLSIDINAMKYINTLHSIITIGSSYIFWNNYDTYLQFHIVYCRDVIQHKVQVTTSQLHMMLLV